jgi:chromosome segregation ATPase
MIKKKMSITNDLIKALEDRHESVEDTIRQVGECLFQLQRALRSKWAPLNVCERRLELRDTRPIQELVRDDCQSALEHERQTLIESRQELTDQIASCKERLIALDRLKAEVIEDLSHKRHGLRIDRSCLGPARPHMNSQQDRVVLPSLGEVSNYNMPPSPKDSAQGSAHHHEDSRQGDTKTLLNRAVRMEEDAMKLCNESDAVMLQTKRECQRASAQGQTSIARRADETDGLKRQLEAQMREIDEAIAQTEMSLGRTKKKLENQEIPLKTLDKQFSQRGKRSDREGIRDHVQDELEGHLETIKKSVKVLTQKFQNTKSLLDNLKESRLQLTEDYRNKLLALKIEDACLKVTPRKAMELDRMDPRGGRCKVASARRPVKKEGVYSLMASMPTEGTEDQVNLASVGF